MKQINITKKIKKETFMLKKIVKIKRSVMLFVLCILTLDVILSIIVFNYRSLNELYVVSLSTHELIKRIILIINILKIWFEIYVRKESLSKEWNDILILFINSMVSNCQIISVVIIGDIIIDILLFLVHQLQKNLLVKRILFFCFINISFILLILSTFSTT